MPKTFAASRIFLLFLLSQQAFSMSDDCDLSQKSELIVRARLHIQQKTLLNPTTKEKYRVPVRLEILDVLKKGDEVPKQVELTDVYPDTNPKWDADAWMKKYKELDGKEVLAFMQKTYLRIPVADPNKDDDFVPMYYLAPFGGFVYDPSPNALRLYDPSFVQTLQECLNPPTPTPAPTPEWLGKIEVKTDFSFFKNAEKWTFKDFDYYEEPKNPPMEMIPEEVRSVLRKEASKDFDDLIGYELGKQVEENEFPDPEAIYSPIYVFKGPGSIKVYALHIQGWGRVGDDIGNSYRYVLYDSEKKKVCLDPISLYARWGEIGTDRTDLPPTVVKPLIEFSDCFGNGNKTFVVEEIRHNGTSTGVLYNYYEIDSDFKLIDVLDLETRYSSTGKWWEKGYTDIDRKIISHSDNEVTVELTMEGIGLPVMDIGSMTLKRSGPFKPFKIDRKIKKNTDPSFDDYYYLGPGDDLSSGL